MPPRKSQYYDEDDYDDGYDEEWDYDDEYEEEYVPPKVLLGVSHQGSSEWLGIGTQSISQLFHRPPNRKHHNPKHSPRKQKVLLLHQDKPPTTAQRKVAMMQSPPPKVVDARQSICTCTLHIPPS